MAAGTGLILETAGLGLLISLLWRCPITVFVPGWNCSGLFFRLVYLQWDLWFLEEKKIKINKKLKKKEETK